MTEANEPAKYDKVTKECHLIRDKQVGYFTSSLGFEPGTTGNKSSQSSAKDLNSWPPDCKTSALIIQPHCLLKRFMQLPKLHTLHRPKLSMVLLYYVHT